ncbi:MAG: hypothetical protein PHC51_01500 [bacterium]|nr:hypothetical protein [bacterium]
MNTTFNRNPYTNPLVVGLATLANLLSEAKLSQQSIVLIHKHVDKASQVNSRGFHLNLIHATELATPSAGPTLLQFLSYLFPAPYSVGSIKQRLQEETADVVMTLIEEHLKDENSANEEKGHIVNLLTLLPLFSHGLSCQRLTLIAEKAQTSTPGLLAALLLGINNSIREVRAHTSDRLPKSRTEEAEKMLEISERLLNHQSFAVALAATKLLGTLGVPVKTLKVKLREQALSFTHAGAWSDDRQMELAIASLESYRRIWSDDIEFMETVFSTVPFANDLWREQAGYFLGGLPAEHPLQLDLLNSFRELPNQQLIAIVAAHCWLRYPNGSENRIAALEFGVKHGNRELANYSTAALCCSALQKSQEATDALIDLAEDGHS